MLAHRRQCFWSHTAAHDVGKAVGDVDATAFADQADGQFGDFFTVAIPSNKATTQSARMARITACNARRPEFAENTSAFRSLSAITFNLRRRFFSCSAYFPIIAFDICRKFLFLSSVHIKLSMTLEAVSSSSTMYRHFGDVRRDTLIKLTNVRPVLLQAIIQSVV